MARRASRKVTRKKTAKKAKSAKKAIRAGARSAAIPKAAPPPSQSIHRFAAAAVPQPLGAKAINTIVYVHGIGNKPPASVLKCQWDTALFGKAVGDRSRMAYWVNREIYPLPRGMTSTRAATYDGRTAGNSRHDVGRV